MVRPEKEKNQTGLILELPPRALLNRSSTLELYSSKCKQGSLLSPVKRAQQGRTVCSHANLEYHSQNVPRHDPTGCRAPRWWSRVILRPRASTSAAPRGAARRATCSRGEVTPHTITTMSARTSLCTVRL